MLTYIIWGIMLGIAWLAFYFVWYCFLRFLNLTHKVGNWIFHSDDPLPGRLPAFPFWLPCGLLRITVIIVGGICAVLLVKDATDWFRK